MKQSRIILVVICATLLILLIVFRPSVREWYEGRIAAYEEEFQGTADPDQRTIQDIIEKAENYASQTGTIQTARARAIAINGAVVPDSANPSAFDNASTRLFYDKIATQKRPVFIVESCDMNTKQCIRSFTIEDTIDKSKNFDDNQMTNLKAQYQSQMTDIKDMKTKWDSIKGDTSKQLSFELGIRSKLPSNKANDKAEYDKLVEKVEGQLNDFIAQEASDMIQIDNAINKLKDKDKLVRPVVQPPPSTATGSSKTAKVQTKSASGSTKVASKAAPAGKVQAAKVSTKASAPPAPKSQTKQTKTGKTGTAKQMFTNYYKGGSDHVERFFNFMNSVNAVETFEGSIDQPPATDNELIASYPPVFDMKLLDLGASVPPYMKRDTRQPLFVKPGLMWQ